MFYTDKVAVLMATYNGEKYVSSQINSLLNQSFTEWELFVHDDGSKDRTFEIIHHYEKKYPDKIHVVNGPGTGGAKNNFLYLMKNVEAPYIMCCDQDDIWLKDKIRVSYECIRKLEQLYGIKRPLMAFSDLVVVDSALNVISNSMNRYQNLKPDKTHFKDLLIQNIVTGCTMIMNKACLLLSRMIRNQDNVIMHDWWCALVASGYGKLHYIDQPLILYRQHENNSVGAKGIKDARYIIAKVNNVRDLKKSLELTRNQAAEFAMTYGLKCSGLTQRYSELGNKNKIERIRFYVANQMWKSGLVRNVGLMLWG